MQARALASEAEAAGAKQAAGKVGTEQERREAGAKARRILNHLRPD
jgi:hypothetical protein